MRDVDRELKMMMREIRTFSRRIGVGEFDDADPALLKQLLDLTNWLHDATEITVKALK